MTSKQGTADSGDSRETVRILHLENDADDALLIHKAMSKSGVALEVVHASTAPDYRSAIAAGGFDLILSDNGLPGFSGQTALELARQTSPDTPFIFVSGLGDENQILASLRDGAADFVSKDDLWRLTTVIRQLLENKRARIGLARQNQAMRRLVTAVQDLSLARDLDTVIEVVRKAARELTGADGATFVLREEDKCFYVEEDAIGPLWKGQRFPMSACISGWAMLNRQPAVIEDIYSDPRIPVDAYRPTFVKSLVMIPIRTAAPIGAIGNYWAERHLATTDEVELLQALANTTAVAVENVQLYGELEQRVEQRTRQMQAAYDELEAFSYSVSHDLRAPLQHISGFAGLLKEECSTTLNEQSVRYLDRISQAVKDMGKLIEDLLCLSKVSHSELNLEGVNLSQIASAVAANLKSSAPHRQAEFQLAENVEVLGDGGLLRVVMENLLSNAWKFTSRREHALIEFGATRTPNGNECFVRDNGVGFDLKYSNRLFAPFQRLHRAEDFSGTGVGLATVRRIIHRHGGRVWAQAEPDRGASFYFTLPS
ncbi:MAG: GAF domain-containing protein [Acidobacteria bacterium]|nr:GAF domain-containing protein [Acidobacteriota bacterium]